MKPTVEECWAKRISEELSPEDGMLALREFIADYPEWILVQKEGRPIGVARTQWDADQMLAISDQ